MKCPECQRDMTKKDSNLFDGEYWEGYKCFCGNVELIIISEDEYERRKADDSYIINNLLHMKICPYCNGYLNYNICDELYKCDKCRREITISELYFKKTGGLKWKRTY